LISSLRVDPILCLAYAEQVGFLICNCLSYTYFVLSHKQTTHSGTQNNDNCQQQNISSTWIYCHSVFSARDGKWVYVFSNDYSLMNCRYCGGISFLNRADRKNFIPNIVLRPGLLSSPTPCAEFPVNPRITAPDCQTLKINFTCFCTSLQHMTNPLQFILQLIFITLYLAFNLLLHIFLCSPPMSFNVRYSLLFLQIFMFFRH
jgi:hypothetical protein